MLLACGEQFLSSEGSPDLASSGIDRDTVIEHILGSHESLVRIAADWHMPDFLALDVTMSQAKVLHLLSVGSKSSMSRLAAALAVSLPSMSGLVDRLVDHGLVERHESRSDRRQVLVELTARGREVIDAFHEVGRMELRSLLMGLAPDDLSSLDRGLAALAAVAGRPRDPTLPDPARCRVTATRVTERTNA